MLLFDVRVLVYLFLGRKLGMFNNSVGIFSEHYFWSGIAVIDRRQSVASEEITNSMHCFRFLRVSEHKSFPPADTGEIEDIVRLDQKEWDDT